MPVKAERPRNAPLSLEDIRDPAKGAYGAVTRPGGPAKAEHQASPSSTWDGAPEGDTPNAPGCSAKSIQGSFARARRISNSKSGRGMRLRRSKIIRGPAKGAYGAVTQPDGPAKAEHQAPPSSTSDGAPEGDTPNAP
ncbi:hypothetical protein FRC06_004401, partial [Ceratobasidium sp. 370]